MKSQLNEYISTDMSFDEKNEWLLFCWEAWGV